MLQVKAGTNKKKIFNDPIYGFITIPNELVFDLIEHPYFQRLRRIKQLGLTSYVYPGALHTRFHHALGAMHLMTQAIEVLRSKGHEITDDEAEGVLVAILLHDIGHGPFSHALENTIVNRVTHEDISAYFMDRLNDEFNEKLATALKIFRNEYPKQFLHQMVASQLDMDRLDYLKRDSFYSGVSEGVISTDRIITMLNIKDDELVVDAKGIFSIEKFIVARRLMYWQVYLHKTVISAEFLLVKILQRARELASGGVQLFATPVLKSFLYKPVSKEDFENDPDVLENFAALDDYDILASIKVWQNADDPVLNYLSNALINRRLQKVKVQNQPFDKALVKRIKSKAADGFNWDTDDMDYLVYTVALQNNAYNPLQDKIKVLYRDGSTKDIAEAADRLNISALSVAVERHFLLFPEHSYVDN